MERLTRVLRKHIRTTNSGWTGLLCFILNRPSSKTPIYLSHLPTRPLRCDSSSSSSASLLSRVQFLPAQSPGAFVKWLVGRGMACAVAKPSRTSRTTTCSMLLIIPSCSFICAAVHGTCLTACIPLYLA